jgi:hypothetical protein
MRGGSTTAWLRSCGGLATAGEDEGTLKLRIALLKLGDGFVRGRLRSGRLGEQRFHGGEHGEAAMAGNGFGGSG